MIISKIKYSLTAIYALFSLQILSQPNAIQKAVAFDLRNIPDSAKKYYNLAIGQKSNNDDYLVLRGKLLLRENKKDEALADFNSSVKQGNSEASFLLSKYYAQLHDTANTINFLRIHLENPNKLSASEVKMEPQFEFLNNAKVWNQLWEKKWYNITDEQIGEARFLLNSGNWLEVINYTTDIFLKNPPKPELLVIQAKAYIAMGNLYMALKNYNSALDISKRNMEYKEGKADVLVLQKKYTDAAKLYSEVINKCSYNFNVLKKRANCYLQLKKYDNLLEDANLLLELFPSDSIAIELSGLAYYGLEKYLNALERFNTLINKNKCNSLYYLYRARVFEKTGMYSNAIKDLDSCIEITKENSEAYKERGLLKQLLNDTKGACSDWTQSEELGNIEAGRLKWVNCK